MFVILGYGTGLEALQAGIIVHHAATTRAGSQHAARRSSRSGHQLPLLQQCGRVMLTVGHDLSNGGSVWWPSKAQFRRLLTSNLRMRVGMDRIGLGVRRRSVVLERILKINFMEDRIVYTSVPNLPRFVHCRSPSWLGAWSDDSSSWSSNSSYRRAGCDWMPYWNFSCRIQPGQRPVPPGDLL